MQLCRSQARNCQQKRYGIEEISIRVLGLFQEMWRISQWFRRGEDRTTKQMTLLGDLLSYHHQSFQINGAGHWGFANRRGNPVRENQVRRHQGSLFRSIHKFNPSSPSTNTSTQLTRWASSLENSIRLNTKKYAKKICSPTGAFSVNAFSVVADPARLEAEEPESRAWKVGSLIRFVIPAMPGCCCCCCCCCEPAGRPNSPERLLF